MASVPLNTVFQWFVRTKFWFALPLVYTIRYRKEGQFTSCHMNPVHFKPPAHDDMPISYQQTLQAS